VVQRNYQGVYGGDAPGKKTIIKAWFDKFIVTGSVHNQSGSEHENMYSNNVEHI
jgi:hypothetical protein